VISLCFPSSTPAERPAEATEPQAEPSTSKQPPALAAFEKTAAEKAASIFGSTESRLKKMEEYRQSKSSVIEGVTVPPKPQEPDNCCMSGCVNCVWERFREDMEDFKAATAEVQRRREAREAGVSGSEPAGVSLDGGSASTDASLPTKPSPAKNMWDDSLYQDLPVGIREFMKTERKLKEAHGKEGTLG
jgi:oxidoreductase family protein